MSKEISTLPTEMVKEIFQALREDPEEQQETDGDEPLLLEDKKDE